MTSVLIWEHNNGLKKIELFYNVELDTWAFMIDRDEMVSVSDRDSIGQLMHHLGMALMKLSNDNDGYGVLQPLKDDKKEE